MASAKRDPGLAPEHAMKGSKPNPIGPEKTDPRAQKIIDHSRTTQTAPRPGAHFPGGHPPEDDDDEKPIDRGLAPHEHPSMAGLRGGPKR